MAQALKCSHCGAPLPDTQASTIRCPFCGANNRLQPTVGQTQVREAVRQILNEKAQQPSPPPKPSYLPYAYAGGIFVMVMMASLSSWLLRAPAPVSKPVRVVAPPPPLRAPEPDEPPTPPKPAEPVLTPWGNVQAVTFDEAGDLLVVLDKSLVKIDFQTFSAIWTTPFERGSGNYAIIIPRGLHIAIVTDSRAVFFDASSGAVTNDFQYRHGGILERACAAGDTQLLVDVLGESVQRFDAATGTKATSGPSCALKDKFACLPGQRCGWNRTQNADYSCRYALTAGKDTFRSCETEDGKKRKVIISTAPTKWEAETADNAETFFGLIDDVVIVGGYRSVFALDKATGEQRWKIPGEESEVTARNGKVYLGTQGTLVEVDAKTGEVLRRLPLRG